MTNTLTRRGTLALAGGVVAASSLATPAMAAPKGPGLILPEGPAGSWDSERTSCPRVLREADGVWKMWYYGRDPSFDNAYTLPRGGVV